MGESDNSAVYYQAMDDEPIDIDLLGRDVYARTLKDFIVNSRTPMVIGIHGNWGAGKTSLMKFIKKLLEEDKIRTVWFNPWIYQFEEAPIIPLLHEIKDRAQKYRIKTESLKLFSVLTSLAGEAILRFSTGGAIRLEDILKQGIAFEEKYFETKTVSQKIHKHFQEVVNTIAGNEGLLVVFIDDLDRCVPPQALKLLEAIKLFLNAQNCIYIIGMAKDTIAQAIKNKYGDLKLDGQNYLDKIIQLPFNIPPIPDDNVITYLDHLNQHVEIEPFYELIRLGVGRNPRDIKRFMNSLLLNHALAKQIIVDNYKPYILIKLLIFQFRFHSFYDFILKRPLELCRIEKFLISNDYQERIPLWLKSFFDDESLKALLKFEPLIDEIDIHPYLHLARATESDIESTKEIENIVLTRSDLISSLARGVQLSGKNFHKINLKDTDLSDGNFESSDFSEACLEGATLINVNFKYADLRKADLRRAHFGRASLEKAILRKAHLDDANFMDTNLSGADFRDVKGFTKIRSFKGASMVNVRNLPDEYIEFAKSKGADFN